MGGDAADVENLQSLDEDFLRKPATDGISSLAAVVRIFDFPSDVCTGVFAVVMGE